MADFKFEKWSKAKEFIPIEQVYIPLLYTHNSKRGNKNHVLNVIILNDILITFLAYGFTNKISIQFIVSIILLIFSFWCIYEVGYFENDIHELKYESTHRNITKINYVAQWKDFPFELCAWMCSLGLGFSGIFLFHPEFCFNLDCITPFILDCLRWIGWLLTLRIIYRVYNYSAFEIRQGIYPLLTLTRLVGPVLFFSINLLGFFLITSQAISRWVWYLVYRSGGDTQTSQYRLVRHTMFAMLTLGVAIIQNDLSYMLSWQFAMILSWSIIRGHIASFVNLIKPPSVIEASDEP